MLCNNRNCNRGCQFQQNRNRSFKKYHNRSNNRNCGFLKSHNRSITNVYACVQPRQCCRYAGKSPGNLLNHTTIGLLLHFSNGSQKCLITIWIRFVSTQFLQDFCVLRIILLIMKDSRRWLRVCTQTNIFQIWLNQTEIRLYLPCTDWFGSKRTSVCCTKSIVKW